MYFAEIRTRLEPRIIHEVDFFDVQLVVDS